MITSVHGCKVLSIGSGLQCELSSLSEGIFVPWDFLFKDTIEVTI